MTALSIVYCQVPTVEKFQKELVSAVANCREYNNDPNDPLQVECCKLADAVEKRARALCGTVKEELEQEMGAVGRSGRRLRGC
eukprot:SAG31_NODE_198_length_20656_cov_5.167291_2_plen_83_part_00